MLLAEQLLRDGTAWFTIKKGLAYCSNFVVLARDSKQLPSSRSASMHACLVNKRGLQERDLDQCQDKLTIKMRVEIEKRKEVY